LREQRVKIGLYNVNADGNAMSLTSASPIMYKGATTEIKEIIGQTCPDLVYPNEADWGYVKVDLDEKSLASAQKHINAIDNATMRLMLLQSLSDSVLDTNLAADQLVHFAMANLEGETDYNVTRKIATTLTSALGYLAVAKRLQQKDYSSLYMEVENLYLRLLEKAEAGSDFQKLWYSRYVSVSKTTMHLAILQNILNDEKSFDGVTIDQDKRWTLVAKMNRYQHGNYQVLLTSETTKDVTDSGVKNAIYSEVLRPEADVKEKCFNIVINNPDKLKLSTLRYIMWGLFPSEQQALEAPYKAKILAHIPQLNKGSDLGLLESFAGSMLQVKLNWHN
jgi:aminopeptidase N